MQARIDLKLGWMLERYSSSEDSDEFDDLDKENSIVIDTFQWERTREYQIKILYQVCCL